MASIRGGFFRWFSGTVKGVLDLEKKIEKKRFLALLSLFVFYPSDVALRRGFTSVERSPHWKLPAGKKRVAVSAYVFLFLWPRIPGVSFASLNSKKSAFQSRPSSPHRPWAREKKA